MAVGFCVRAAAIPFISMSRRGRYRPCRGTAKLKTFLRGRSAVTWRFQLRTPNEALLPSAFAKEAAGSLCSLAAIMIDRRRRPPRR
jgi:hypothetical protein